MWIKFGDTLLNLDLIKKIHPVEKLILHVWGGDRNMKISRCYGHNQPRERQEEQIRREIQRKIDENHFAGFGYSFDIEYLNETRETITGKDEQGIGDARDELYLFVSGNQPQLPCISIKSQIVQHNHSNNEEVAFDGDIGDW